MYWFFVVLGGIIDPFWVLGLKYSQSWWQYALTALTIIASFTLMILATKKLEVSTAYAVFVGIGAVGVALFDIFISQNFEVIKLALIFILMGAVVGLKLIDRKNHAQNLEG